MATSDEQWRQIPGYESLYTVSSHGRVQSHWFNRARILRLNLNRTGKGRWMVMLSHPTLARRRVYVHHLVAEAFVGPQPDGCECNHKDGNSLNNDPNNLEWVTHRENMRHASNTGLLKVGQQRANTKLTIQDVRAIRYWRGRLLQDQIASRFGVDQTTICDIHTRRTWAHLP